MTEENAQKKKRNRYPDRLSIDPANLEKLGRLIDELKKNCRGCDVNRKEMLNYLIERAPDRLTGSDLKELSSRYYDETKLLKSALHELKAAKARGESVSLDALLQRNRTVDQPAKALKKRKSEFPEEQLSSNPVSDV